MNLEKNINQIFWEDSNLDKISIDDKLITIKISSACDNLLDNSKQVVIICKDFIALTYLGGWDEATIESIKTSSESDFIKKSINAVLKNNPEPYERPYMGETKRLDDPWVQLEIKLSDGADIVIVCQSVEIVQEEA